MKTAALIVDNPHSGCGIERSSARRARYPDLEKEESFEKPPKPEILV